MKNSGHKAFWRNFKFKYKLTVINENTLEEVMGIHVSKLNGLSVLLSACTVIFLIAALIIAFTPLRNYLPGYMNSEVRAQVVDNALRADSLAEALNRQKMYIMNIQDILEGRVKTDTVGSMDSLTSIRTEELMSRTQEEERFRQEYERKERYNLRSVSERTEVTGLIFYRPSRGVITTEFNPEEKHFGVDLATASGGSVLSALDNRGVCRVCNGLRIYHSGPACAEFYNHIQELRFADETGGRPRERRRSYCFDWKIGRQAL